MVQHFSMTKIRDMVYKSVLYCTDTKGRHVERVDVEKSMVYALRDIAGFQIDEHDFAMMVELSTVMRFHWDPVRRTDAVDDFNAILTKITQETYDEWR
jgi:hypothetical protein